MRGFAEVEGSGKDGRGSPPGNAVSRAPHGPEGMPGMESEREPSGRVCHRHAPEQAAPHRLLHTYLAGKPGALIII